MARQESDREDLLREATALVERIELSPPGATELEHIIAGFRSSGAMSVYFGADPAYQFNAAGELRRAFIDGLLYKAESGALISLERVRAQREVQLVSRRMAVDAQASLLTTMHQRLQELKLQISGELLTVIGQVPADADVLHRVEATIERMSGIPVANSPHVR